VRPAAGPLPPNRLVYYGNKYVPVPIVLN
jgi:hypothetical protein